MTTYLKKLDFESILEEKFKEIDTLRRTGIVSISAELEIYSIAKGYQSSTEAALKGFDSETTSFAELEKVIKNYKRS